MPFNTRNPIPSGDLRDLDDNARNIDTWANDKTKLSHPDRFGVKRRTWHGIEQEAKLNIQQAIDAKNAAQEAAMMSGFSKYADTLAQLEAGIGTDYVDGDVVMVFQDESRDDTSSIFKIESGVAEFKLTFDKTRQDLLSFTGNISTDAEWSDVPAHSDPAFDVQTQALANRVEWIKNRTKYVTPEDYGAIGDGVADDSDAIIAANAFAAIEDLPLVGEAKYLLTKPITITARCFDFSRAKLIIAPSFLSDVAITWNLSGLITKTGSFFADFIGNRDDQSTAVTAVKIMRVASLGNQIGIRGYGCNTLVNIHGNTERVQGFIYGGHTDVVCRMTSDENGSPDENLLFVGGTQCKQYFVQDGSCTSDIFLNCENQEETAADYPVKITGQRVCTLSGVLRTPHMGAVFVDQPDLTLNSVAFNNLQIVSPTHRGGLPIVHIKETRTASGSIKIIEPYDTDAFKIEKCLGGDLSVTIQSLSGDNSFGKKAFICAGVGSNLANMNLQLFNIRPASNTISLDVSNILSSEITYKGSALPISLSGSLNTTTLRLPSGYISSNIAITDSSTGTKVVALDTPVTQAQINAYTTPVAGMRAFVSNRGDSVAVYSSRWLYDFSADAVLSATPVTNVSTVTVGKASYIVKGGFVNVFGSISLTPSSAGNIVFRLTLPIATTLTKAADLTGNFSCANSGKTVNGGILGNMATNSAEFRYTDTDTDSKTLQFNFLYSVN